MAYEVRLARQAVLDVSGVMDYMAEDSPGTTRRWLLDFEKAVESLEEMPRRCPLIPEFPNHPKGYRHLMLHSHRIIFRVDDGPKQVYVVRVYHMARRPLRRKDLD